MVALPPLLEEVERWIQLAGRSVQRGVAGVPPPAPAAPALSFPVLIVQQGAVPVGLRVLSERESMLEVFVSVPFPPDLRTRLAQVDGQLKLKLLFALRRELLSSGRTGFGVTPPNASSIEQVEGVAVNQQISVKGAQGAEVSRLLDGLVEVATAVIRAISVVAPLGSGGAGTATPSSPQSPDASSGPGRMFG